MDSEKYTIDTVLRRALADTLYVDRAGVAEVLWFDAKVDSDGPYVEVAYRESGDRTVYQVLEGSDIDILLRSAIELGLREGRTSANRPAWMG